MNSSEFSKQFPSAFGRVFNALLAGISTMLLGVFCMTTQLYQKVTTLVTKIIPFAFTSLMVFSFLVISNVFVTNQVEANHAFISMKWRGWYIGDEQGHHERTLLLKNNTTDHPRYMGDVRMLREDLDAWSAQMKWYVDDEVNDGVNEVLQGQSALFSTSTRPLGTILLWYLEDRLAGSCWHK